MRLAGLRLGLGLGAQFGLRRLGFGLHFVGGLAGEFGLAGEIAEPVFLGEAARGGCRRFNCEAKPIPAPEVALDRNEPLARPQLCLQGLARVTGDDADLSEAAGERGRRD